MPGLILSDALGVTFSSGTVLLTIPAAELPNQQWSDCWLGMQAMPLELSRQPWMDLPDAMLTPTQRAALKEHDKKVQVR